MKVHKRRGLHCLVGVSGNGPLLFDLWAIEFVDNLIIDFSRSPGLTTKDFGGGEKRRGVLNRTKIDETSCTGMIRLVKGGI